MDHARVAEGSSDYVLAQHPQGDRPEETGGAGECAAYQLLALLEEAFCSSEDVGKYPPGKVSLAPERRSCPLVCK